MHLTGQAPITSVTAHGGPRRLPAALAINPTGSGCALRWALKRRVKRAKSPLKLFSATSLWFSPPDISYSSGLCRSCADLLIYKKKYKPWLGLLASIKAATLVEAGG